MPKLDQQEQQAIHAIRIARRHSGYFSGSVRNNETLSLLFKFDNESDPSEFITALETEDIGNVIRIPDPKSITVVI